MTGGRGPGARRSRPRRPSPSIARASSVRPSPSFYRLSPLTRRPRCPCPARRTWPDPVTAPHLFERDSCRGFPQPPRAFHHRDERGVGAHREVLEVETLGPRHDHVGSTSSRRHRLLVGLLRVLRERALRLRDLHSFHRCRHTRPTGPELSREAPTPADCVRRFLTCMVCVWRA